MQPAGQVTVSVRDGNAAAVVDAQVFAHRPGRPDVSCQTGPDGSCVLPSIVPGVYTVSVAAHGFALGSQGPVAVRAGAPVVLSIALQVAQASEQVTVNASETNSIAQALAPLSAPLTASSARTDVPQSFIDNFLPPTADYGEAVNLAPATFTTDPNGIGLGQSKTTFRGFPDGSYDIDFDGVPVYDTNDATHHSWAFFPAPFLGGVSVDRSPGEAATIGPTPFGGSIHLLSREISPLDQVRATLNAGSYQTYLYDVAFDSGSFSPGSRADLTLDVHHLQSQGYQSGNTQVRNAGDLKAGYRLGEHTYLGGYSSVLWLDANTPSFSATRCQIYGVTSAAYNCFIKATTLYPFTGAGRRFLLAGNNDPLLYLDPRYNLNHVPTDLEYLKLHSELPHGLQLTVTPYTYSYDNSAKSTSATTITEATTVNGAGTYLGLPVAPCNVPVTKKGITALPCGLDKYLGFRKYGETAESSSVSRFGVLQAGLWYEWARSNRHQLPSDPANGWADQPLPNFAEHYTNDAWQPYVQYQAHLRSRLTVTAGLKWAVYRIHTQQFADDGKVIGGLGTNDPSSFITNGATYAAALPAASVNVRLRRSWSAYGQYAEGSVMPPSSVFDYKQGNSTNTLPIATLPSQQRNRTLQAGTVLATRRLAVDADIFHVHFDNSYSSVANAASGGEPIFYAQPSSVTQGVEGESTLYLLHGVSLYGNASYNRASYAGSESVSCIAGPGCLASTAQLTVSAPAGLDVQLTPRDIEAEGVTYQRGLWDVGLFNKRVGRFALDNGSYHDQAFVEPFQTTNLFVNYTLHRAGAWNGTRLRLSINNLLDAHSITGLTLAGSPLPRTLQANGTSYSDPFLTNGATPMSGQDNVSLLPGRSILLTVTLGHALRR